VSLESSQTLRAIVTGSAGFVGRALMGRLPRDATRIHLAARDWRAQAEAADYREATVFHLAARNHDRAATADDFTRDNVEKTAVLARLAAVGGARRLIYLSTIKVLGEETGCAPFLPSDPPNPQDDYARSKLAAEDELRSICRAGLAFTIVRAPLVVGPDARGNLLALMRLADSLWPLPFGAIDNRRTLVQVDDLAALLYQCASSSEAPGRVFLAGDPHPVSTPALVRTLRKAFGRPPRLMRVNARTLEGLAALLGSRAMIRRLTRSLEVDASDARTRLGWTNAVGVEAGLISMARAYRSEYGGQA
jgi:UDP-glucose 4-epimerase